ncbi:MAG: response regulator [Planctomycetota bacterium]|nr:MAG: response regulator [Planctomycetota bacterium]
MKILIVEDNFVSRNLLVSMLSKYGVCHVAVNGQEAVNAFKESAEDQYDLICLDISMPIKRGLEALKEIRAFELKMKINTFDHTKIVMVSALDDKENITRAYSLNCDGFLAKPIKMDELQKMLSTLNLN